MKEDWFFESLFADVKIGLKIKKNLCAVRSGFQQIKFLDTYRLGKMLVLDGVIQTTAKDEFIYHEMMTHIPLFSHPAPKDILVIGAGDGGILRELLKHKNIQKVTLVEIDEKAIVYCKKYLTPICGDAFESKKVELVIADGAKFVVDKPRSYDVAIIDSPDPIGPGKVLFQDKFYRDIQNCLCRYGIMVRQSGSSFFQQEELKNNYNRLRKIFKYCAVYTAAIPTYIGGLFDLIFCSSVINPLKINLNSLKKRFAQLKLKNKYYNPEIHSACFKLPNYIKQIIGGER